MTIDEIIQSVGADVRADSGLNEVCEAIMFALARNAGVEIREVNISFGNFIKIQSYLVDIDVTEVNKQLDVLFAKNPRLANHTLSIIHRFERVES